MTAVLVTGAGRRIGRAFAEHFARAGRPVFLHYNRSAEEAEAVAAGLPGARVELVRADLRDGDAAADMVRRCDDTVPLACVINNASVFDYDTPRRMDARAWRDAIDVNLYSPLRIAEAFHQRAAARAGEHVLINILDNKVHALNPDFYSYSVSKAGLHAATRMMAMSYAPHLRVCGIAPGITLISGKQTEESFQAAHRMNPLGRGCSVPELIAAAEFILSCRSLSGQVLTIDGGQSLMALPRDVAFLDEAQNG